MITVIDYDIWDYLVFAVLREKPNVIGSIFDLSDYMVNNDTIIDQSGNVIVQYIGS